MAESIPAGNWIRRLDELRRHARLKRRQSDRVVHHRHLGQRPEVECAAHDGCCRKDCNVVVAQSLEAPQDRVAHGLRNPDLSERLAVPSRVRAVDVSMVKRVAQHLLEHERVAFAAFAKEVAELVGDRLLFEDGADHVGDLRPGQRAQVDQLHLAAAAPALDGREQRVLAVHLICSIGRDDEHVGRAQAPGRIVEQLPCRRVRPLQVLQDEQEGATPGSVAKEKQHGREYAGAGNV